MEKRVGQTGGRPENVNDRTLENYKGWALGSPFFLGQHLTRRMRPKDQSIVYSRPEKGNHFNTILYEIEMLEFCYETLVTNVGKWGDIRKAFICLEAFLLHYRNLVEFFGGEAGLSSSEPAIWSPRELSAEEVASISDRNLCDKYRSPSAYLQHCTPLRANLDRSWNVYEMHKEILPLIDRFQRLFPPRVVGADVSK